MRGHSYNSNNCFVRSIRSIVLQLPLDQKRGRTNLDILTPPKKEFFFNLYCNTQTIQRSSNEKSPNCTAVQNSVQNHSVSIIQRTPQINSPVPKFPALFHTKGFPQLENQPHKSFPLLLRLNATEFKSPGPSGRDAGPCSSWVSRSQYPHSPASWWRTCTTSAPWQSAQRSASRSLKKGINWRLAL